MSSVPLTAIAFKIMTDPLDREVKTETSVYSLFARTPISTFRMLASGMSFSAPSALVTASATTPSDTSDSATAVKSISKSVTSALLRASAEAVEVVGSGHPAPRCSSHTSSIVAPSAHERHWAVVENFDRPLAGSFASLNRVSDGQAPLTTHDGKVVVVVVPVLVEVVAVVAVTVVLDVVALVVVVLDVVVLVVAVLVVWVEVVVGQSTSSDSSAQSASPSQYQASRMHCSPVVHKNESASQWYVVVVVVDVVVVVVVLVVVSSDAKHWSEPASLLMLLKGGSLYAAIFPGGGFPTALMLVRQAFGAQ